MTKIQSKGNISKSLLIAWAALLVSLLIILTWVSLTPLPPETPVDEESTSVDLKLPDALPLNDFLLKDKEKKDDSGGSASNQPPQHEGKHDVAKASISKLFQANSAKAVEVPDGKIRVAFVFSELGLNDEIAGKIMESTPPGVTFAFLPQGGELKKQISKAREKGHEILLNVPMESSDYPNTDTGPNTLLTGLKPEENLKRTQWALTQTDKHIGFMNFQGSLFLASEADLHPILDDAQKRGIAFIEAEATYRTKAPEICKKIGIPYLKSNFVLNESLTPEELHAALIRAEQMAKENGSITIVAHTSPLNVQILLTWIQKAQEQEYVFLPISQLLLAEKSKQKGVS